MKAGSYDQRWLAAKRKAQAEAKATLESWKRGRVLIPGLGPRAVSKGPERTSPTWCTKRWTRARRKDLPATFPQSPRYNGAPKKASGARSAGFGVVTVARAG